MYKIVSDKTVLEFSVFYVIYLNIFTLYKNANKEFYYYCVTLLLLPKFRTSTIQALL